MNYFIGIDGGGSKTHFVLVNELGIVLQNYIGAGSAYRDCGVTRVIEILRHGIARISKQIKQDDIAGVCFGMPCLGESEQRDRIAIAHITRSMDVPICFYNDVAVGWAGSLAFSPGINIVAGTGSMATGRDESKAMCRSGGWCEFFSDEGSCYWIAKRTLELFSKQADGRLPKSALYFIIKRAFSLQCDFDLIDKIEGEFASSRKQVATVQRYAYEAAGAGDQSAILLYEQAALELAMMVAAVAKKLDFAANPIAVSYSGGLFRTGDCILRPLKKQLGDLMDARLVAPKLAPELGAVLFAVDTFAPERMEQITTNLLKTASKA